ncbi:glycosyltransferase family 2 protein [Rossellomorea sp. AcN35-11]|nr:glycosyltransferase [Rossellomorea aquimaris]WJV29540.1 glycosyltransferase family 2 protein [Rossellomorea sp. AcN35-11]
MNRPLVSVVIPAYNRPDTLKTALDSVLGQSYPLIEIIICDDSSDDRVKDMVEPYLAKHTNIEYVKNEQNLFLKNWQKCYDLAQGEFINYLMDDDVFHPDKIKRMIYFYENFDGISLVTSHRQTIDETGEPIPPFRATRKLFQETRVMNGRWLGDLALTQCLNMIGEPTTVLFRKKDLQEPFGVYKGSQYSLLNDVAAWLNLLAKGKAVYIADTLSYFRIHPSQNNQTLGETTFSQWLELIVSSREDGFLASDDDYVKALLTYRNRIQHRPPFSNDVKRIDEILSELPE